MWIARNYRSNAALLLGALAIGLLMFVAGCAADVQDGELTDSSAAAQFARSHGQSCVWDWQCVDCEDGQECVCRRASAGQPARCWPPATVGDYCNQSFDCDGTAYCDLLDNVCRRKSSVGEECIVAKCSNGLICRPNANSWAFARTAARGELLCYEHRAALGETCTRDSHCARGLACRAVEAVTSQYVPVRMPNQTLVNVCTMADESDLGQPCARNATNGAVLCKLPYECSAPVSGTGLFTCSER